MQVKKFITQDKKVIIFRPLILSDLKRIKKFAKYINDLISEKENYLHFDKKFTYKQEQDLIIQTLKSKTKFWIIAEHKEKIIGIIDCSIKPGRMKHVIEMGIAVNKKYRRMGLGAELIKLAVIQAKKRRCKFMILYTAALNKNAIVLYKKLGFKKVAVIPKQMNIKGKFVDDIIMMKKL